jgi:DNA-binding transcriptional MerR regulator
MSAMMNEAPSMTIGEVLSMLSGDFPEISISKIRFLEAEGLISPRRAPSGYRRFAESDVDQLRLVLIAQRDRYLPLRVIKDHLLAGTLQQLVAGESRRELEVQVDRPVVIVSGESGADGRPGIDLADGEDVASGQEASDVLDVDPAELLTRRELATRSGLSAAEIDELTGMGVVHADPAGRSTGADLLVCRAYSALKPYGVESRHLRQVKNSASRDAQLIRNATGHLTDVDRAAAVAAMVDAFSDAHYWQVIGELDRHGPVGRTRNNGRRSGS